MMDFGVVVSSELHRVTTRSGCHHGVIISGFGCSSLLVACSSPGRHRLRSPRPPTSATLRHQPGPRLGTFAWASVWVRRGITPTFRRSTRTRYSAAKTTVNLTLPELVPLDHDTPTFAVMKHLMIPIHLPVIFSTKQQQRQTATELKQSHPQLAEANSCTGNAAARSTPIIPPTPQHARPSHALFLNHILSGRRPHS